MGYGYLNPYQSLQPAPRTGTRSQAYYASPYSWEEMMKGIPTTDPYAELQAGADKYYNEAAAEAMNRGQEAIASQFAEAGYGPSRVGPQAATQALLGTKIALGSAAGKLGVAQTIAQGRTGMQQQLRENYFKQLFNPRRMGEQMTRYTFPYGTTVLGAGGGRGARSADDWWKRTGGPDYPGTSSGRQGPVEIPDRRSEDWYSRGESAGTYTDEFLGPSGYEGIVPGPTPMDLYRRGERAPYPYPD